MLSIYPEQCSEDLRGVLSPMLRLDTSALVHATTCRQRHDYTTMQSNFNPARLPAFGGEVMGEVGMGEGSMAEGTMGEATGESAGGLEVGRRDG